MEGSRVVRGQPRPPPLPLSGKGHPALIQDTRTSLSLIPCPLHLDICLARELCVRGWAWALLPPWLWPCLEIEGKDPWVRSGRERGSQVGRQGLGWDSGWRLTSNREAWRRGRACPPPSPPTQPLVWQKGTEHHMWMGPRE